MPCRGGLFRDQQVTLFTNDGEICNNNVKTHWSEYVKLSDRVLAFYTDQDGEDYLELDAFDTFKKQILTKSTTFDLNSTLRESEQTDLGEMVDLIARSVFRAQGGCPQLVKEKLAECQGNDS
jgi:hypothetical protein